jgi:sigma-E factor negative regulatory protein RseB
MSRRTAWFWPVALAGLLPVCTWAADARDWLTRMEQAVETMNYEGTFVHIAGGTMETMQVVHRVKDGRVTERLYSRDQPGREVIRKDEKVTCIFADQRTVLVERRKSQERSPLRAALPRYSAELDRWYEFREGGNGRKLGRVVRMIEVLPRDSLRYGHRLWLDEATAMPLKVQLVDSSGHAVEEVQFVSIELPATIPDARLEPAVDLGGFSWYVHDPDELAAEGESNPGWTASDVPSGFRLMTARRQFLPGASQAVEHLVYSDGLASISVFVEPADSVDEALKGASRIGGASAFSTVHEGHQITAVGEVPASTVREVARSLRRVAESRQ